jgi:hypothetical protein
LSEETHVLEPYDALPAEHRHGLHGVAEAVHRHLDFVHVAREAIDDLAREVVRLRLGREGVEALLADAPDEEVIGPADEGEGFGGGRGHGRGFAHETHESARKISPKSESHHEGLPENRR